MTCNPRQTPLRTELSQLVRCLTGVTVIDLAQEVERILTEVSER